MLYNCKLLFERIKTEVKEEIETFPNVPRVCVVVSGDDESSRCYVRNTLRDFEELGIDWDKIAVYTKEELTRCLRESADYDGIIVQRPIDLLDCTPKEANNVVSYNMFTGCDIDGVVSGSGFMPPSVRGLDLLLHEWSYDPAGKTAVVLGRGNVGRPVAEYLLERNATVVVCHSRTPESERKQLLCHADMVVGAAGLSDPIYPLAYPHGVVIDYGITTGADGKLHGDFVKGREDYLDYQTTVPGGMGLMVRSALLLNIIDAYKVRRGME